MEYRISGAAIGTAVTWSESRVAPGLTYLAVHVSWPQPTVPEPITLKWRFPCCDIYSTWSPNMIYDHHLGPNWRKRVTNSRLASGAPLHSLLSYSDKNRLTVTLSDAAMPHEIASGVREEGGYMDMEVRLFTQPTSLMTDYQLTVRLDTRDIPYEQALEEAEQYWTQECGYSYAPIPDTARRPLYSCWYSFHQTIDEEAIVHQCRLAKALGMESVIVDDGWQTDDEGRGYAYCGDWKAVPSKVRDMKTFIDRVHEAGLKFILWYSVPFVGIYAQNYERFKGMYLDENTPRKYYTLDPRFPEVREFLVNTYRQAALAWGLDGFKLDFIDSFRLADPTKTSDPRWDTTSLEVAVDRLLSEITETLRAINPDMLIEFRQSYIGPTIRKYGNMMRVGDCPADSMRNHICGVDLRFLLGRTPVHSDMLLWPDEDTVESAAHQVLCCLFTVPQISVLLDRIPEAHVSMLRFLLGYWNENRDILLDGRLKAQDPAASYTLVSAENETKTIAVAYHKPLIRLSRPTDLDFFNATGDDTLFVSCDVPISGASYTVFDCTGRQVSQGVCPGLQAGDVWHFPVPTSGLLRVTLA